MPACSYPLNESYHASIAYCYDKLKMSRKAHKHHRRLICISPNNPSYHLNYAMSLYKQDKQTKDSLIVTKYHFEQALKLCETQRTRDTALESKINGYIARFYHMSDYDTERSKYHFERALELHGYPQCHYNYARLLQDMHDFENADYHYLKAIELYDEIGDHHHHKHGYKYAIHYGYFKFLIEYKKI